MSPFLRPTLSILNKRGLYFDPSLARARVEMERSGDTFDSLLAQDHGRPSPRQTLAPLLIPLDASTLSLKSAAQRGGDDHRDRCSGNPYERYPEHKVARAQIAQRCSGIHDVPTSSKGGP